MFWDHGYGMGWSWIWVVLVMLIVVGAIAAVIFLVVKSTGGPPPGGHPPPYQGHAPAGVTNARAIAEERLARGEVTPDEYREIVRALDETSPPRPGS